MKTCFEYPNCAGICVLYLIFSIIVKVYDVLCRCLGGGHEKGFSTIGGIFARVQGVPYGCILMVF